MADLIKPKELVVKDEDGNERTFILSKFDAVTGREIVTQYPMTGLPKIGDYKMNEELMFKLMSFICARTEDGKEVRLTSRALVINHVPEWEMLFTIEKEMMKYNCDFFRNGQASTFFDDIARILQAKITETLTSLLGQSLQVSEPPSTNSEPSTT